MKISIITLFVITSFGFSHLANAQERRSIPEILENAKDGEKVDTCGIVTSVKGGAGKGYFVLQDKSSRKQCIVVSTSGLPKFQSEACAKGTYNKLVNDE